MTTEYTATLRLNKPEFRDPGWGNLVNDNMDNIDRITSALFASENFEPWANNTLWEQGRIALDTSVTPTSYWICNVDHTSAIAPTTFAQDRAAHPTYWSAFLFSYRPRGAWTHDTQYLINDITYDTTLGITAICKIAHISNHAGTINDDAANWDYIVNLPSSLPAASITYNNATSGLVATNVQTAIDEVDADLDTAQALLVTHTGQIAAAVAVNVTQTSDIAALEAHRIQDKPQAGDVKFSMNPTPQPGWLICNDGSLGNAGSGATLYGHATASVLFTILWNTFPNSLCPVSGGRGASAIADFAALKNITITRMMGRVLIAAGSGSGLTTRPPGIISGAEIVSLGVGDLPSHAHSGTSGGQSNGHTHDYDKPVNSLSQTGGGAFPAQSGAFANATSSGISAGHTHPINSEGSGVAHPNMQPAQSLYALIRVID